MTWLTLQVVPPSGLVQMTLVPLDWVRVTVEASFCVSTDPFTVSMP
jgi:hypothetical protein